MRQSRKNSKSKPTPAIEVSFAMLPLSKLGPMKDLYDPKTPGIEPALGNALLPLIVAKTAHERYEIVDGCKRFANLRKEKRRVIAAAVISAVADRRSLGLLRARLNKGRTLHLREKLILLKWLRTNFAAKEVAGMAEELGISTQEFGQLAPLCACRSRVIDAVAKGTLHLSLIRPFMLLSEKDQDVFLNMFEDAALSFQTQRELLEWLPEIAFREKIAAHAVLGDKSVTAIISDKRLNWPQRIEKIRHALHARRFPLLAETTARWNKAAQAINPNPSKVTFFPSPSFEKDRLEVRVILSNPSEASGLFQKLASVAPESWQALISPTA
jgi:hypothetical protein